MQLIHINKMNNIRACVFVLISVAAKSVPESFNEFHDVIRWKCCDVTVFPLDSQLINKSWSQSVFKILSFFAVILNFTTI